MNQLTDTELLNAYARGDESAFALLVQRYLPLIYRFQLRMARDTATAEDLTQETFLKAWTRLKTFNTEKAFKPWIFTIAKNVAIDFFRKQSPIAVSELEKEENAESLLENIPDLQPLPNEVLERKELLEHVDELLSHLSPKARAVILMHDTEEMTFQEIADATGEPLNTVKSRYRRGLLEVAKILQLKK